MWKIIVLLWSIPLALGLVIVVRMVGGTPAISDKESRFLLGNHQEMTFSLWMGFKFGVVSVLFFVVGVVEGLALTNIGSAWLVSVPLVTGLGVILVLVRWVRCAGQATPSLSRNASVFDFHAQ